MSEEQKLKPFEYNVTLTEANTQYSQKLPDNTKSWTMKVRTAETVRWARSTGKVAGGIAGAAVAPYLTMDGGGIPFESGINTDETIYIASAVAGVVVEIRGYRGQF